MGRRVTLSSFELVKLHRSIHQNIRLNLNQNALRTAQGHLFDKMHAKNQFFSRQNFGVTSHAKNYEMLFFLTHLRMLIRHLGLKCG